jgi:hypothetical protein
MRMSLLFCSDCDQSGRYFGMYLCTTTNTTTSRVCKGARDRPEIFEVPTERTVESSN